MLGDPSFHVASRCGTSDTGSCYLESHTPAEGLIGGHLTVALYCLELREEISSTLQWDVARLLFHPLTTGFLLFL